MLIKEIMDMASTAVVGIAALFIGMALSKKLAAIDREIAALARIGAVSPLKRPDYRPRRRFSFHALRKVALWILLVVAATRAYARCTPDPQPAPGVIDCAHADSRFALASCAVMEALSRDLRERLR